MSSDDWFKHLVCPYCETSLTRKASRLTCATCGDFVVQFGVPILLKGVSLEKQTEPPSPLFVEVMAKFLELSEAAHAQISDCFRLKFKFEDPLLQIEADQFLTRLRNSGIELPSPYATIPKDENVPREKQSNKIVLEWLVLPKQLLAGTTSSLSIIITNETANTISSTKLPFRISYFFERGGRKIEGLRTDLLIDIEPGRRITLPIHIRTPNEPGQYTLTVLPLIEGVRWMEEHKLQTTFSVVRGGRDPLQVDWRQEFTPENYDYYMDPARGVQLCNAWVAKHVSNTTPNVLEVGGNFHPRAMYMKGTRFNVEIDPYSLMSYNIKAQHGATAGDVHNVVATGTRIPFADNFFDAAVMFATFHHFSDPIGLLKHLRTKLSPNGILLLMCEPIGHVFSEQGSGDFVQELKRGVYEQSFMPWEYREMLKESGFEIIETSLDPGSLKIAARKSQP